MKEDYDVHMQTNACECAGSEIIENRKKRLEREIEGLNKEKR